MTQPEVRAPFGRLLTAMVTPFTPAGELDVDGAQRLAVHLVDDQRNDGLVISGTTGESPTTSDEEKDRLLRAVVEAVGDRAAVVAGVGTNDTAHTVHLAHAAEKAGADGLLLVTPYYNKPPQAGLLAHFRTAADATGLPAMLYDIPGRTGAEIATDTLLALAEHPRIVAVKDAKDSLPASAVVLARTDLAYYSGTDVLNLPLLSIGATGFVSVVAHVVGARLDVYRGVFRTQGVILTKAALALAGLPGGPVRPPLVDATEAEIATLKADLAGAGVALG
jgi:4-hydroxy-tetrahydrodipicolinate synthase